MEWLLHEDALSELQELKRAGVVPNAEQLTAFEESQVDAQAAPRNLKVVGAEAEILVEGILTEKPRFFFFRDGTTYSDIRNALAIADADPGIKRVVLRVNSPGGNIDGLFDTVAALEQFSKPIRVVANKALSAAFALASAGGKIEAAGKSSQFGSVGIVASFRIFEDEVMVTNTDSAAKNPDPTTDEGKAIIRKHLDDINALFVEAIAKGRSRAGTQTTATGVKTGFGRGAILLAQEAKRAGMIDKVTGQQPVRSVIDDDDDSADFSAVDDNNRDADDGAGDETMDLNKLKTEHAALHDSIMEAGAKDGHQKSYDAGVDAERERVNAHLIMGEQSGDTKTAFEAIKEGTEMTPSLQATYMAAGMAKADTAARQQETDDAAAAAAGGTSPDTATRDLGDDIADALAS